jgi:hypothetical protein
MIRSENWYPLFGIMPERKFLVKRVDWPQEFAAAAGAPGPENRHNQLTISRLFRFSLRTTP